MSDQPIIPTEIPTGFAPATEPVVFPSDSTPFAAPAPDPVPAEPAPSDPPAPGSEVVAPAGGQVVDLPSGYKVALRATRSVRARERRGLFEGVDFETKDPIATGMAVLGNIQRMMIVAWDVRDFDDATGEPVGDVLPIPSTTTEDVLGGLSLEDADALDKATQEIQKVLLPNFNPSPDPTSPTPPSAG